jgi:hypothetical protein
MYLILVLLKGVKIMKKKQLKRLKLEINKKYKDKPFYLKMPNGETFYGVVRGIEGDSVRMEMLNPDENGKLQPVGFGPLGGGFFSFLFPLLFFLPFFGGLFDGFGGPFGGLGTATKKK